MPQTQAGKCESCHWLHKPGCCYRGGKLGNVTGSGDPELVGPRSMHKTLQHSHLLCTGIQGMWGVSQASMAGSIGLQDLELLENA